MSDHNYQRVITVDTSPEEAYRALTEGYEHWWTTTGSKSFKHVGDRIKFAFPPLVSYWVLEAKTLEPNKMVELECVEAYHEISQKPDAAKTEWLGTTLRWKIEPRENHTNIQFIHEGLNPNLHCYEVCEAGWDLFFVASLTAYLNTGTGTPFSANRVR